MLDLWQNDSSVAQLPQGRDLPATMGETFGDAWSNGQLATSGIKQFNAKQQALNEYLDSIKKAGGDVDAAFTDPNLRQEDALGVANSVVSGLRAKNPALTFLNPKTQADIDSRAVEISQGAIAAHAQMGQREQAPGAWLGNLAGGVASGLADPYNIPMMATPLEGVGILGTAARVGLGMAGTQMANETANAEFNEKVQPGYFASGQPQANVAEAALGGAALGAGGKIIGKGVEAVAGRFMGTAERDASNAAQSEANIAQTNVLPGIEGEAAHPAALGKAIDDVLNERPVDVSQQVGALEPQGPPPYANEERFRDSRQSEIDLLNSSKTYYEGLKSGEFDPSDYSTPDIKYGSAVDKQNADARLEDINKQIASLQDDIKENPLKEPQYTFSLDQPNVTQAANDAPHPATMTPDAMRESIANPATHDAARADVERAIDDAAKSGKALQIPMGLDENGNAIMGSATRALNDVDGYKALGDAIAQCALPMADQAEE